MKYMNFLCGVGIEQCDIVDLEMAKFLKRNGFNKPTIYYWYDKNSSLIPKGIKVKIGRKKINHNKYDNFIYSAPTREQVVNFLKSKI